MMLCGFVLFCFFSSSQWSVTQVLKPSVLLSNKTQIQKINIELSELWWSGRSVTSGSGNRTASLPSCPGPSPPALTEVVSWLYGNHSSLCHLPPRCAFLTLQFSLFFLLHTSLLSLSLSDTPQRLFFFASWWLSTRVIGPIEFSGLDFARCVPVVPLNTFPTIRSFIRVAKCWCSN